MLIPRLIHVSGSVLFFLLAQLVFSGVVQAQSATITLQGRAMYSTGEPAAGASVTLTKTVDNSVTTNSTTADGAGNYSFQVEARCGVSYDAQATSSQIVDDEPLPPSGVNSTSGCVLFDTTLSDLVIIKPHPITLGGRVLDQTGEPMQGITVTMTRTKYNLTPNDVKISTTTSDADGHYQFNTFSRCAVVEEFTASFGQAFAGPTGPSGCVTFSNDSSDLIFVFSALTNGGSTSCNLSVGRPVNVSNGNVYLQQTDHRLPSVGESIDITRSYNSVSQNIGLFGRGWTTVYDEAITTDVYGQVQLTLADGRLVTSVTPDFLGQIAHNGDGTYTVTFKNGSVHQFNASGQLLTLTDRNGNRTVLAYGGAGLSSITDPFGRVVTVNSNGDGRVLSLSDSIGTIATYTYGSSNELLRVTYPDNSGYQFSYTSGPRGYILSSVADALGNMIEQHDYDFQGRATSSQAHGGVERYTLNYISPGETDVTDALGHITRYFHHSIGGRRIVGRVEGLCGCGGSQVQTWTYDNQLNVTNKTDALNHSTTYTFDTSGNRLTETDATGTVTFTYNQFGEVLTRTDQMNGVATNAYDAQGNLLSSTDARGKTTSFANDSRGLLLTITDARGKVTGFAYDAGGNLITRTDALSHATQFAYDARGRMTSVTNALGHVTALAYDAVGRLTQVTQADGTAIGYEYDLAGRRTAMVDAKGNRSTYSYDGASRLISETDALNQSTTYSYDTMSNLTASTDALGKVTNFDYDDFNRMVKITYPPATTGATRLFEALAYDTAGNVTQRTDTAGRVTSYAYDDVNRVISTTDADNKATTFEYDPLSRMTALVDALGQRYRFNYDKVGQLRHIRRGATVMSFTYDAVGNRKHRVDYNGATTVYDYDALNRLKTINYPDTTTVTYTYDKLSRLQTATNENGTIDFDYNKMNRLTSATDVFGQTVDYNYDANGNRTKLSLNAATAATYRYDAMNRLSKILDAAGAAFTFDYDATNKLTQKKAPNNVKTNYQYDGLDRLTRLTDTKGVATLADHQYQYNTASQVTQIAEPTNTRSYGYDAVDRLTSAAYTNPSQPAESYAYNALGNRTSSQLSASYSYQPFNRLTSTSSATYSYDTNGNLISKTNASGTTQFSWDFENRLKQVTLPNGNTVAYKYDALGRRIQRAPSLGVSTNFIYDGQDVVKDLNSDGSTVDYLNGPGVDNKLRLTDSRLAATGPLYFLQDHLGSTTALTNSSGVSVSQMTYDSFGNSTAGASLTRYTYTGREFDSDAGLYYYRARWYDPQVGRFISEDPAEFAGGLNFFAYVGGNPVNVVDPQGLWGSVGLWKIHQAITRRALSGLGLSASDLKTLVEEQYHFDHTTQAEQYAYMHAMRMRGERPVDARRKANQFVRCRICKAQKLAREGKRTAAMQALSQAMHTVQDAASPAHANFAEAWQNTTWQTLNHLPHYGSEDFDPGPGSVSYDSTVRIWRNFTGESPMPDDFFSGEFDLNKYGRGYFTNRPAPDGFTCECCE